MKTVIIQLLAFIARREFHPRPLPRPSRPVPEYNPSEPPEHWAASSPNWRPRLVNGTFANVASNWTPDYHKKADRIRMTEDSALDSMLHVALENAIKYEGTNPDRQLYWLRCAMLAQDELNRR